MDFRGIREFFKDTFKYIVVAVAVFLLFIFVVGLQQVVGPSMSPTLQEGNVIVVNKMFYTFNDVKRGDIIVLSESEKYMIKRVIGIAGDYVEYKNNSLYINGELIEEDYLNDSVYTDDFSLSELGYTIIPENMYFVLGDNREDSLDSRSYGLISKKQIIGKTWFCIWPLSNLKFF